MTIVDGGAIPYIDEGDRPTVIQGYQGVVEEGRDPAQIAEEYHVKVARIHEALAFYYDNAERMMRLDSDSEDPMSTGSEGTGSENGNSSESVGEEVIQRAKELKQDLSEGALRERIEELESDLEAYRTRYDHDSPEEADQFADIDDEVIREWETTRADKAVATLALRLSEAVSTIEMDRLETATAERDDWSQSPPSDAGEALLGDGPENDIADMPDLGRSPLPDRGSDDESD